MAAFDYARLRATLADHVTASWPVARMTILVDGHRDGLSFGDIATKTGMTRSACIGKGSRLGLPPRAPQPGQMTTPRVPRAAPVAAAKAPAMPALPQPRPSERRHLSRDEIKAALALPGTAPVMISALSSRQCRWPVGDPRDRDFSFCGRLKPLAGPYCAAHAACAVNAEESAKARKSLRRQRRYFQEVA